MALDALSAPKGEDEAEGDEKVLILISSLLSWDATPKKLVEVRDPREIEAERQQLLRDNKQRLDHVIEQLRAERSRRNEELLAARGEESDNGEEPKLEENNDEEDLKAAQEIIAREDAAKPQEKKVFKRSTKRMLHQAFTELDYEQRRCSEEYASIREAEDLVLNFKKEGVKTYVIAAGVLYGMGESILNSHFEKAWKQEPARIPVVGSGHNLVPTVHVTDLARMVAKIFETKPERKYIFGIDNTPKPTQKRLVKAISNGVGTGLIESIDIPVIFPKVHPNQTPLKLDSYWDKDSQHGGSKDERA